MIPVRIKYLGEARKLTFDFASKMSVDDALTGSATIVGSAGITLSSATSDLATGLATVLVSGGTLDSDYLVSCTHATANGETLVLTVTVEVRADAN